ncbi:MAG TPA: hypothetical protein VKZ80_06255 [Flavobacterium sp.]|nr:hypothetical protein [Flavobacterium sp.]
MKRFFISAVICGSSLLLWNCKSDDETAVVADRDRLEVYNEDLSEIETFLKENSIKINEENIEFTAVESGSASIWDQSEYPLQSVQLQNDTYSYSNVTRKYERIADNVDYKVYYLIVNEGGGETPMIHDNVFTSYTGYLLDKTSFDTNPFGFWSAYPAYSSYSEIISGYRQILQQVKTASGIIDNGDGTYTHENPGRVIVFIPSGLGYFSTAQSSIGTYTPLIFDITLIASKEADHDNDGILDKYEDVNNNGNLWDDDTDGDGKPDFLDLDDDGDGYTTREEITYTTQENGETVTKLYPFDQIPTCEGGSVKKHLDKNCH